MIWKLRGTGTDSLKAKGQSTGTLKAKVHKLVSPGFLVKNLYHPLPQHFDFDGGYLKNYFTTSQVLAKVS